MQNGKKRIHKLNYFEDVPTAVSSSSKHLFMCGYLKTYFSQHSCLFVAIHTHSYRERWVEQGRCVRANGTAPAQQTSRGGQPRQAGFTPESLSWGIPH